jgi:hypothetical protein
VSAGWSLVALLAWVALPGLAMVTLLSRGEHPAAPVRALTVGLATGLSVWFLGSELLARLDLLSTTGAVVATSAVGAVALVVIAGPGRRGLAALRRAPLLPELGVMVLGSVLAAAPLVILVVTRPDSLSGPTPWYYLGLARAVVHAHGLPSESIEWVSRIPFLDDYPGFTAGTALLLSVGGAKSMAAAQAVRLLTLVAVGASAYLFARAAGAARSAAAVTLVVLFVGTTYAGKLASYRPEASAYALVFLVAALAKLWMNERRNVDLAMATITLLALSEVHGIGWLFSVLMVGGIAAGGILFSPARRSAVRAGALLVGVLGAGWLFGNLALGGSLSGSDKLGGLPASEPTDPTWRFVSLVAGRIEPRPSPTSADIARRGIDRGFVELGSWWYLAVILVVVALLLVVAWRGRVAVRRAAREYSVLAFVVVAACTAISVYFALRWTTYVPLRTGWGRLFPLTFALLPAAVALVITSVSRQWLRALVASGVLALGIAVMVHGLDFYDQIDHQQPSRAELSALRDLHLSGDDLVLTNTYSEGFVGTVLGAQGVLDGRAPYSEPKTLERANTLLGESIRYFADPQHTPLPEHAPGIDYVLVATTPSALGTPLVFGTNYAALAESASLRLVREGPGFRLYAVVKPDS